MYRENMARNGKSNRGKEEISIPPTNQCKEEDNKPILAAIYARVSSPNQKFGYSLDEQVRICRERSELMGWKIRYIFTENGSGSNTDRPKFQMTMEKAKRGTFDVMVLWKLDRFCRWKMDESKNFLNQTQGSGRNNDR